MEKILEEMKLDEITYPILIFAYKRSARKFDKVMHIHTFYFFVKFVAITVPSFLQCRNRALFPVENFTLGITLVNHKNDGAKEIDCDESDQQESSDQITFMEGYNFVGSQQMDS